MDLKSGHLGLPDRILDDRSSEEDDDVDIIKTQISTQQQPKPLMPPQKLVKLIVQPNSNTNRSSSQIKPHVPYNKVPGLEPIDAAAHM